MTEIDTKIPALNRLHWRALIVGIVCAGLCLIGAMTNHEQFINSYLFAYLFILGLSLGSMAIVLLHHMTGGDWGYCIRRPAEAAMMMMPVVAILFIPIALNVKELFPWANPEIVEHDKILQHQALWMNERVWTIRAIVYFSIWSIIAFLMWHGSRKYDRTGNPWLVVRMRTLSAFGILIYVVTMSLASVDWIMAREAHWYSTILGLITCVGQALSALVLLIALLRVLMSASPLLREYCTPPRLNDLGNLFLTLTILWAYMSFAQLLIVWMGNINVETPWYVRRGLGGMAPNWWKSIGLILLLVHFFIPFFALLSRANKRRIEVLGTLAMAVLILRVLDLFWWAGPTSLPDQLAELSGKTLDQLSPRNLSWMDFLVPPALFCIWLTIMLALLKTRPLLARMEEGPEVEPGGAAHAHASA